MNTNIATFALLACLTSGSLAHAQPRERRSAGVTVTWTAIGAGAGFSVGLWAGLNRLRRCHQQRPEGVDERHHRSGRGCARRLLICRALGTRDSPAKNNPANPSLGISAMRPSVLQ
jgi:hypothetical protein